MENKNNLKSTDLMVGDWVICHHPSMPESFERVSVSLLHTLEQQEHGHIKEEDPLFRIVKPISITEEFLLKYCEPETIKEILIYNLGYNSYGNSVFYHGGVLYFNEYGDLDDDKEICDCLYVHTLQRIIKYLEIQPIKSLIEIQPIEEIVF